MRTAGKSASSGTSRTAAAGSRALLTRKSGLVRAATAASLSWATVSCSGVIRLRKRELSTMSAAMHATYPAVVSGVPIALTSRLRVAQVPRPSSARSSPSRAST
ncbi:hypothetical protein ONO86_04095 [Micromonospora noduli]|nr:hypothetical protein ONO86_04095 [Micromonospora noduli]